MKKFLNFAVNTNKGQKLFPTVSVMIMTSLVIGIILNFPIFWLGGKEYETTWMNTVAPYFFYAFFAYAALIIFLFIPYLWYVGTSEKYKGSSGSFIKAMAIFCSVVPGGFIYSFVAKALLIPSGIHNLAGMLIFGLLYLWIMKIILKKQFGIAQTFVSLS